MHMYVSVLGGNECLVFGKYYIPTKWMIPKFTFIFFIRFCKTHIWSSSLDRFIVVWSQTDANVSGRVVSSISEYAIHWIWIN